MSFILVLAWFCGLCTSTVCVFPSSHLLVALHVISVRLSSAVLVCALTVTTGTKLMATKLGLCAIAAHLNDTDFMALSTFDSVIKDLTPGFVTVAMLKQELPRILSELTADGGTACFDAVKAGLASLVQFASFSPEATQRNVLVCLTDGDDNASATADPASIFQSLQEPGVNNFMFMLMAVDMRNAQTNTFADWFRLTHAKQLNVCVKSGSKLVCVFQVVLMGRILQTDDPDKLYRQGRPALFREGPGVPDGPADAAAAAAAGGEGIANDDDAAPPVWPPILLQRSYSPCAASYASDSDSGVGMWDIDDGPGSAPGSPRAHLPGLLSLPPFCLSTLLAPKPIPSGSSGGAAPPDPSHSHHGHSALMSLATIAAEASAADMADPVEPGGAQPSYSSSSSSVAAKDQDQSAAP
jgi:hypothetical protein